MILVFEEDRIITSMAFIVIVSILEFLLCTVQALTCTFPMGVLERNCLLVRLRTAAPVLSSQQC